MATNVTNPTIMATPRSRFLFGSTMTNLVLSGSSSPRKISGRRWNRVSPKRPPTANATITESDEGSILGGHSARRKLGGPDIYRVARRALTAGEPGKRNPKSRDVKLEVVGLEATLCSLRACTRGHCCISVRQTHQGQSGQPGRWSIRPMFNSGKPDDLFCR
jgi:hypothetical protein